MKDESISNILWGVAMVFGMGFVGGTRCAGDQFRAKVCPVAATTAPTLRDSVALNNAGCDLKLSTVQPETPR